MKETLINGYLKIEPIEHTAFIASQKDSFEEIGLVLAVPDTTYCFDIEVGDKVFFDSFMAKKYPIPGQEGKFQWFVHINEIVKYEREKKQEVIS